jgi:hypothetical protein
MSFGIAVSDLIQVEPWCSILNDPVCSRVHRLHCGSIAFEVHVKVTVLCVAVLLIKRYHLVSV